MERKVFAGDVRAVDEKELIVEAAITTEHVDRVGDVVRADGVRIKGKPVVLFGHGRDTAGMEPVAKPLSIRKGEHNGEKALIAKTRFFPDERGRRLFRKVKEGYINGWSIGFSVISAKPRPGGGRDIKEWELLEYSLVGVPANPNATTVKNLAFGIAEKGCSCNCSKAGFRCGGHKDQRDHQDQRTVTIPLSRWRGAIR